MEAPLPPLIDIEPQRPREPMMDPHATDAATQSTKLNRRWLIKMFIFLIALTGLGLWGLVDALVVFPNRGRESTEYLLKTYLEEADRNGQLLRTSVEDPAAELQRLRDATNLTDVERARLKWLEALALVANLSKISSHNKAELSKPMDQRSETPTTFPDPKARLDLLTQKWATQKAPKPLSGFDIPMQWVFVVVGFGGALYMATFLLRTSRVKFYFQPEERRLTLPTGKSFTPADMEDIDKRLWHKFFLFVTLNDGSPEIKLDLLRYSPLEAWILEMWEHSPNYVPEEEESEATEPSAPDSEGETEPHRPTE